jgi:Fic family protein
MKREEFSQAHQDHLVDVPGGCAYVPPSLPPTLGASWELTRWLDQARASLATLDGKASLIQNRALVIRPLATREAMLSARLEGTHTHVTGVLLQEAAGPGSDLTEASNNQEVINYLLASELGQRWLAEGRPVNSFMLRSLHQVLLTRTRGERMNPGRLRTVQVLIGSPDDTPETARFVPPPPEHVQPAIEDLIRFVTENRTYPPLIAAGIAHYQFEVIHPFEDGNGRLGRLLIPLQLMAVKAIEYPLIYLSPFFEARRDVYLRRLKDVSTRGAWEEWLRFFLQAVHTQAIDALLRVTRILELHDAYRTRVSQLRSRVPPIAVDLAMERTIVTVAELRDRANCDHKTAKSALDKLTELGIVKLMPPSHPQRWIAQELIDAVYDV